VVTTIDVPGVPFPTQAIGVNSKGDIVGIYSTRGFLLNHDGFTTIYVPGAMQTFPHGINDTGHIVGSYANRIGRSHGFVLTQ